MNKTSTTYSSSQASGPQNYTEITPSYDAVCRVTDAKQHGNHAMGFCPCHDDRSRSLSISHGKRQAVIVKCQAGDGCSQRDIHEALKAKGAPVFAPRGDGQGSNDALSVRYTYHDERGSVVFRVVRKKPKGFFQQRADGNGGWINDMKGVRALPYRLPEVLEATALKRPVFIVEGEKDCDNLARIGVVATCNAGGAGKWTEAHAAFLKGVDVILIPDNDKPGHEHVETVAVSLHTLAERIRLLNLPGLPEKGDASNWIEKGGTADELWKLAEQAPNWGPRDSIVPSDVDYWNLEPWPEPVDLATLLNDLRDTIIEYSILPPHAAVTITLWIVFAHTHNCFWISAILALESPERRCGKSFLMDVIELLTPRPDVTGNISVSAAFRLCDEFHPTFIWDEVKRFITPDKQELIGLLESGYRRRSAWVRRTESEGRNFKVRRFSTWSPKVVALIGSVGQISDTIEDRSIRIRMRRKTKDETCKVIRQDRIEPFVVLNRQAARWAEDNAGRLAAMDPQIPDGLHDRQVDNWRPLLGIAQLAGEDWARAARIAANHVSGIDDDEETGGALLLRHCKEVFDKDGLPEMSPSTLVSHLCGDEEWPWSTWRNGRDPITPRGIVKLLRPYGIKSKKSGHRMWLKCDFEDAWRRYL